MAQMNVSVPDALKNWCEAQVSHGRYSTTSDYVRDLIRQDQNRQAGIRALQAAIDEALQSGVNDDSFEEILQEARRRAKSAPHAD